ncbi:MAG: PQQ-binding-like beta-propeller repeat protein [Opitutaceae bacterium]
MCRTTPQPEPRRTNGRITRTRAAELLALALLAALADRGLAAGKVFTDPAPPAFEAGPVPAAAQPRENPEATAHTAPRALVPGARASDWPNFLGPAHNLTSVETRLRRDFPAAGLTPVWEMRKGEGFASPVVVGERLVLFHRVGNEEVVDCVQAGDGRRFWQVKYPTAYRDRYGYNPGPRASPAIAAGRVFTFGAEGRLHCIDLASGRVNWRRDLHGEFGIKQNFFGVGASPLVAGDVVIVQLGAPGGPGVAAFDVTTGRMRWGAETEWGASYASPVPAILHGRERVLVFAGGESRPPTGGLLCLDPKTGAVDFRFPWRGTRYESVNAASPVVLGDRVLVAECYGSGGVLVEARADGTAAAAWRNPTFGMHFMSALRLGEHLYGIHGHGPQDAELVCVEVANGREVWRDQPLWTETVREPRGPREIRTGTFRAFLLAVDGQVLALGEFGHLVRLDLSPKGVRVLERAWLFAATETWTPPALSRGLLYVCQNTRDALHGTTPRLLCYDLRGE